jgi:hypothetical protein
MRSMEGDTKTQRATFQTGVTNSKCTKLIFLTEMVPIFEEEYGQGMRNGPVLTKIGKSNNSMEVSFKVKFDGMQNQGSKNSDSQKNSIKISYMASGGGNTSSPGSMTSNKSQKNVRLNPIKN